VALYRERTTAEIPSAGRPVILAPNRRPSGRERTEKACLLEETSHPESA